MTIAVGKADYSGSGGGGGEGFGERRPRVFKLGTKKQEDRVMVLRIAPPIGECAEKGTWATFIKQHYGYTLPYAKKDGTTGQFPVTFICPERRDREGNITQHCAECDEIRSQREKIKSKEALLKNEGKTQDEIDQQLGYLKAWTRQHNLDKKWHFIAKNLNNEWAFGAISHTCFQLLKGKPNEPGLIDTQVAKNKDPLGVENGVWFRFTRNGSKFNEITDVPSIEQTEIEPEVFKTKTDSLTQADFDALEKLPSLNVLAGMLSKHITPEQVSMLLASGNEEKIVRSIFNMPERKKGQSQQQAATPAQKPATAPVSDEPSPEELDEHYQSLDDKTAAPATEAPPTSSAPAPVVDDEEAALKAQLAALQAKKAKAAAQTDVKPAAAAPAAQKPAAPAPKPTGALQKKMDLPMEDFLASYEK